MLINVDTLKMIHTENIFKLWAYSYSILHQFCISANLQEISVTTKEYAAHGIVLFRDRLKLYLFTFIFIS